MTSEKILQFVRQHGGSVDWHPLLELGLLPLVNELVSAGLLKRQTNKDGVTISLTDKGNKSLAQSAESPQCSD